LDLALLLGQEELETVVAEASYRGLASDAELKLQIDGNDGRRGVAKLRRVLDLPGGPRRTRSPAERRMLRLLREAGMTGFETNARICGYEVDLLWRDVGLAVEIDGWDAHSGRTAFERDRLKVATLNANGITVMPITGRQIGDDPVGAVGRLRRALAEIGKKTV
jgi:very-short-patch-repair endonuclease